MIAVSVTEMHFIPQLYRLASFLLLLIFRNEKLNFGSRRMFEHLNSVTITFTIGPTTTFNVTCEASMSGTTNKLLGNESAGRA